MGVQVGEPSEGLPVHGVGDFVAAFELAAPRGGESGGFGKVGDGDVLDAGEDVIGPDRRVDGLVRGERLDLERHRFYTEIKGVTYHDFRVWQENGCWHARVIFDV